ncbi:MAG: hypothetical protein M1812_005282 [Candelaria pacifica]|nr:MAG: hypothetical protein M1812_005282 [Candelaria pacifica]
MASDDGTTAQVLDQFLQHRLALRNAVDKECNQYEKTLREELVRREHTAKKDGEAIQAVPSNQNSLRERASRVEALQQENDELRARLNTILSGHQGSPNLGHPSGAAEVRSTSHSGVANNTPNLKQHDESSEFTFVPREKYDTLATKYDRLSQDFVTVQDARKALIARWNKQKHTIDLWKVYTKKYLEKVERREKRLSVQKENARKVAEAMPPNTPTQGINRAMTPSRITDSGLVIRSVVDDACVTSPMPTIPSRDISPVFYSGTGDPTGLRYNTDHTLDTRSGTELIENQQPLVTPGSPKVESTPHMDLVGLMSPQLPSPLEASTAMKTEQVDAAEMLLWDGQNCLRTPLTVKAQHQSSDATTDEGHQVSPHGFAASRPDGAEDVDQVLSPQLSSDSPVVVSERSLKRKRPVSGYPMTKADAHSRPNEYGSAVKPIRLKSEQGSSSPIVAGLEGWQEGGESLDLDEVGNRVNTPRKRTRFQDLIRGSQRPSHLSPQISIRPDQPATNIVKTPNITPVDSAETPQKDPTYLRGRSSKDLATTAKRTHPSKGLSVELLNAKLESARKGDDAAMSFLASLEPGERDAILQEALRGMGAEFPKWGRGKFKLAEGFSSKSKRRPRESIDEPIALGSPSPQKAPEHSDLVPASENYGSYGLLPSASMGSGSKQTWFRTPDARVMQQSEAVGHNDATTSTRVLHPRNINTKVLPRTSEISCKEKPKTRKWRDSAAAKIPSVAEDGESNYQNRRLKTASVSNGTTNEVAPLDNQSENQSELNSKLGAHQRLGNLLEDPSPEKRLLLKGGTSVSDRSIEYSTPGKGSSSVQTASRHAKASKASAAIPLTRLSAVPPVGKISSPQRQVYADDGGNPYLHGVASRTNGTSERSLSVQPDDEPFRARPLQRLSLEHFKINPEFNQGLNYAFVETVRNRDQRHCLPGCTRPECCGDKFRKLIKIGGAPTPQRPGLWESSQIDEDQRLLEQYLGDDRSRLESMEDEERQELLIQAKTKQFADKWGKHRHAYERRTTPPGFWRTDMPTTQETEQDRLQAKEMERQKVDERYREAMRPGGRWLFRDE